MEICPLQLDGEEKYEKILQFTKSQKGFVVELNNLTLLAGKKLTVQQNTRFPRSWKDLSMHYIEVEMNR